MKESINSSIQEALNIATNWPINGELNVTNRSTIGGSMVYELNSGAEKFYLKSYTPWNSVANVQKIHEVWDVLHANNFRFTPTAIKAHTDTTTKVDDGLVWEISTEVPGIEIAEDSNDIQLASLTRAIGNFHICLKDIQKDRGLRIANVTNPQNVTNDLVWWTTKGETSIKQAYDESIFVYANEFAKTSSNVFAYYLDIDWMEVDSKLPKSVIHRDLTKHNVLFTKNRMSGLIDFEIMQYGSRLHDIARILIEFTDCSYEAIKIVVNEYGSLTDTEIKELKRWMLLLNCGLGFWTLKKLVDPKSNSPQIKEYLQSRLVKAVSIYDALV